MAATWNRTRVTAIALLVIVVAASIALRSVIPNQTSRMAIGFVEIVLIAILARRTVRST